MGWQDTERGHTGMATVMYEVRVWCFEEGMDQGQCEDLWNVRKGLINGST